MSLKAIEVNFRFDLLLLLSAAFSGCIIEPHAEIRSGLRGLAIDSATQQPISGVSVYLKNTANVPDSAVISGDSVILASHQIFFDSKTDSLGFFSTVFPVERITPAVCRLLVLTKSGYFRWQYSDSDSIQHIRDGLDSITVKMLHK